jgi:two-component system LytT family response regulator
MMNCIAVDDEPLALKVIQRLAGKVPFLEMLATYQNPILALEFMQENPVDLMFLDVQMPDLTGIQFLQSLPNPPKVIFTTAHSQYAVDSYELDAVDYLLKPIPFDRFLKAVNKAYKLHQLEQEHQAELHEEPQEEEDALSPYLFLKSDTRIFKVKQDEIRYIEGMRDYIAVHTADQRIMTLMSLSKMLKRLPQSDFIRVHKSYIINFHHISLIQNNRITIGDREIPISNTYREEFFDRIEKRK